MPNRDDVSAGDTARGEYPVTISVLPSASLGHDLEWVLTTDPIQRAETLMGLHKFSQLPVIDHGDKPWRSQLAGFVTWASLARAALVSSKPQIGDALADAAPQVVGKDMDLFRAIPLILDAEAVLVEDQGRICGIVTAYDLTAWLADRAEPFFALVELEVLLRNLVSGPHNLSMRAHIDELSREETWERLCPKHDRKAVGEALRKVNEERNHLMHGRELEAVDSQMCRNVLDYLRLIVTSAPSSESV